MKHPSQEDLLGYVLGALDAQEQRDLQLQIDADPELEEKLLEIKSSLVPLEYLDGGSAPRPGLARRTSEMVANFQTQLSQETAHRHPVTDQVFADGLVAGAAAASVGIQPASMSIMDRVTAPRSWALTDMLVGVAAAAVLVSLLLPAISYTRFNSRVVACQNNLRCLGNAMLAYSDMNADGQFPQIPVEGNLSGSGFYAVQLKESGLLPEDDTVLCQGRSQTRSAFFIPSREQLNAAFGPRLESLRRTMGGDYGFTLGYIENEQYHCASNQGRTNFIILSDMPSQKLDGRQSANHGGYGQNCLFEDGHVEFVKGHSYGEDPIFENDHGIVAPGAHSNDSVIAPSHLRPHFSFTIE